MFMVGYCANAHYSARSTSNIDGGNEHERRLRMPVGEESVMTRWEAEYKTIQALPAKDRAKIAGRKIIADATIKIAIALIGGGGGLAALTKLLSTYG